MNKAHATKPCNNHLIEAIVHIVSLISLRATPKYISGYTFKLVSSHSN